MGGRVGGWVGSEARPNAPHTRQLPLQRDRKQSVPRQRTHHVATPSASSLKVCIIAASVTSIAISMPKTPSFVCAARSVPPSAAKVSVSGCSCSTATIMTALKVHHVYVCAAGGGNACMRARVAASDERANRVEAKKTPTELP